MKGKFTARTALTMVAFFLGVIALVVSLSAGLKTELLGISSEIKGLIFGKQKVVASALGFSETVEVSNPVYARLSGLGVILLLLAPAAAFFASFFVRNKAGRFVILGLALVALLGVVFVFLLKNSYISSEVAKAVKEMKDAGVDVTSEMKKEMITSAKAEMSAAKLNTSAIILGAIGAVEVICMMIASFVGSKK